MSIRSAVNTHLAEPWEIQPWRAGGGRNRGGASRGVTVRFRSSSHRPAHHQVTVYLGGDRRRSFWRASIRTFAERKDPSGERSRSSLGVLLDKAAQEHTTPTNPRPESKSSATRLLTERLRRLLESTGDIGITHFRREAEELLTVSRKALWYLLPTATLIVRSPEGTAAPVFQGRPVAVSVPKQGRTAPQTGGALSAQQRGKKRNRKRNRHVKPMPPTPAQISESVSKVDERTLIKLQERFNTRRM